MGKLYVDPGVRACGVAMFDGATLVAAGLPIGRAVEDDANTRRPEQRSEAWISMAAAVRRWADENGGADELMIELPQVYKEEHQSAKKRGTDPNDLIHLAAVVGAVCAAFASVPHRVHLPMEWKGQIPKEIMHERARARLTPAELALIPKLAKSLLHNTMDAVCLGLVAARRLKSPLGSIRV